MLSVAWLLVVDPVFTHGCLNVGGCVIAECVALVGLERALGVNEGAQGNVERCFFFFCFFLQFGCMMPKLASSCKSRKGRPIE